MAIILYQRKRVKKLSITKTALKFFDFKLKKYEPLIAAA